MTNAKLISSFGVVAGTIKPTPGRLLGIDARNKNVAVRYLQLFNRADGVPTGAPVAEFDLQANGGTAHVGAEFFGDDGVFFSLGITYGFSTTSGAYAAGTAADHKLTATIDPALG